MCTIDHRLCLFPAADDVKFLFMSLMFEVSGIKYEIQEPYQQLECNEQNYSEIFHTTSTWLQVIFKLENYDY